MCHLIVTELSIITYMHITINMSMVVGTKVLCPLFYEIEILVAGDSQSIFPSLDKI